MVCLHNSNLCLDLQQDLATITDTMAAVVVSRTVTSSGMNHDQMLMDIPV